MMYTLLAPAMAIMSRLRFALKLGLVGMLFMAPIVVLVYFLYGKTTADIEFAEKERLGVLQTVPTGHLLNALSQHRLMSQRALGGDAAAREQLPVVTADVDNAFAALSKVNDKLGASLKTNDGFEKLLKMWKELKINSKTYDSKEDLEKHNDFIEEIIDFMTDINDGSNLSMDAELDSFHIIEAITVDIPNSIHYLGQLHGTGHGVLQRRSITTDENSYLKNSQKYFSRAFAKLSEAFDTASKLNNKFAAVVNTKPREASEVTNYFLSKEKIGLLNGDLTMSPTEYLNRGAAATSALESLSDLAAVQLDLMLLDRIHRQQTNLAMILGGTGVVLLLVLYLFGGMLLSVLRSLKSIEAGAERLAKGEVSALVDSRSKDELRDVGNAVNSVVQTLQKFTNAQLDMARAHNQEGRISHEMRVSDFAGAYGDMARNTNDMVKSHIGVQTQFVELMVKYANGDFASRMPKLPGERQTISATADKLREVLLQAQEAARDTLKIKIALDSAASCVMMADNEGIIRYQNKAMKSLMQRSEKDFQRVWPGFSAAGLDGSSFDRFHKDPNHQRTMLANLKGEHSAELQLGSSRVRMTVNPIADESGARLGSVIECLEHTSEVVAEREIGALVEAAAAGDFSKRIDEDGKSGFLRQMAQGLNQIVGTSEQALGELSRIMKALAAGDLSQTIETEFKGVFAELKANSNATIERLREIIGQIREASESINTAAREIAQGNNDLSKRTEEQASSLEETASGLEEFAATVRQNADNAQAANRLSAEASNGARRGGEVVSQVVTTMNAITESNREIADITTLIDGIAFQTNLLALNAAVEAARAGEQGRGFAVVASEVRTLAQRAADAARDIKTVIQNSVGKVEDGAKLVNTAGAAMDEIVGQVERVNSIIGEIAAASGEQSNSVQQLNQAVTSIDQITQQNAALVEEATAAARSLEDQSEGLVKAVAVFKVADGRAGRRDSSPPRPNSRNGAAIMH